MLYKTVSLEEPCQLVACHPVMWHERGEPTTALVEASLEDLVDALLEHGGSREAFYRVLEAEEVSKRSAKTPVARRGPG